MIKSYDFQSEQQALNALVDAFAKEMKAALQLSYERDGKVGWDNHTEREFLIEELAWQFKYGTKEYGSRSINYVHVANFAAFLWNLKDEPQS